MSSDLERRIRQLERRRQRDLRRIEDAEVVALRGASVISVGPGVRLGNDPPVEAPNAPCCPRPLPLALRCGLPEGTLTLNWTSFGNWGGSLDVEMAVAKGWGFGQGFCQHPQGVDNGTVRLFVSFACLSSLQNGLGVLGVRTYITGGPPFANGRPIDIADALVGACLGTVYAFPNVVFDPGQRCNTPSWVFAISGKNQFFTGSIGQQVAVWPA